MHHKNIKCLTTRRMHAVLPSRLYVRAATTTKPVSPLKNLKLHYFPLIAAVPTRVDSGSPRRCIWCTIDERCFSRPSILRSPRSLKSRWPRPSHRPGELAHLPRTKRSTTSKTITERAKRDRTETRSPIAPHNNPSNFTGELSRPT